MGAAMKRFQKVYLEISNLCNLRCGFCPGTRRAPGRMTEETFTQVLSRLAPYTDYLYFHLMGEPLCHPELERFLALAGEAGFRVILTTNGTLLESKREVLLRSPSLHKVNVSLHAFEANDLSISFETYLEQCFAFGQAAQGKVLVVYRPCTAPFLGSGSWSGREPGSETGSIWSTGRNSTGRIWARPKQACGSATGFGIR